MGNLANMNLEINEEVVKTIFQETLSQSIITAMGNKEEYIAALINTVLQQKVDNQGEVSRYPSDNKYNFIDIMVQKTIRKASEEAILEYVSENKEILKATVKKEMEKEKNKSALVNAFVRGAVESFEYDYRVSANLKIEAYE